MTRLPLMLRLAAIALVCVLLPSGVLGPLQSAIEDHRFDLVRRQPTGRIVLVDIDEPSIRAIGVWPWSRSVHAAIVDRLRVLQAADIAFDVDFSSPSLAEGDTEFEAALKRADGSVMLAALQQATVLDPGKGATLVASRPLDRFAANAWEGSVDVWPDPDGRIRRFSRGEMFGATLLPSLAALLGAVPGVTSGRFTIDYGIDAGSLRHVSVGAVLDGTVDPSLIKGRSVIVGASALELRDFFQVPRFGLMAGSVVQAMAAESLLQGRALQPAALPSTLILVAVVLGLVCLFGKSLPYAPFLALCLGTAVLAEASAIWVQAVRPIIVNTAPLHAGLIAFVVVAVSSEVADRRVKLLAARRGANHLRIILDRVVADNFAGIVVADQNGIVRAVSEAAVVILGPRAVAGVGRPFRDVLPPILAEQVASALTGGGIAGSCPGQARDVQLATDDRSCLTLDCVTTISETVEPSASNRRGSPEFVVCLTFRNVTDERRAQIHLAEMARLDVLSGLANRFVLLQRLDEVRAADTGRCEALVLFDLDRFKLVNDRLGHAAGDTVIRAVADRLRTVMVPGDLAARLGGDEFALVVERASPDEVRDLAEILVRHLGGPYGVGDYQIGNTVSVGFAIAEGPDSKHLMRCADAALYAAKVAGGDRSRFYDAALKVSIEDGKAMEHELRDALQRGELEVFYQRQVDAEAELIVGVEALVRWKHPERGYVSPAKFIPVAERTGLIEPLGQWVLATACRDAASWPLPIKVSVNLSAVQLARADLADTVVTALADAGLAPNRLDLELTETLLVTNDELVRLTLGRLRDLGIKISLDDFGTGYSSLSYLRAFAVDKVKIDQSFVRDLVQDAHSVAVIRAVVGLARDLGLRVNAEGVETAEQLRLLRTLGCDEVQGYLHGRPEPSSAIRASLAHQLSIVDAGLRASG